mmetsp:Transcript_25702/g.65303  ORF Transcript_25702/g.65303 Transcript_25702/m.65303 type:complete len:230 (-) Transcript_25702:1157-1846(-)
MDGLTAGPRTALNESMLPLTPFTSWLSVGVPLTVAPNAVDDEGPVTALSLGLRGTRRLRPFCGFCSVLMMNDRLTILTAYSWPSSVLRHSLTLPKEPLPSVFTTTYWLMHVAPVASRPTSSLVVSLARLLMPRMLACTLRSTSLSCSIRFSTVFCSDTSELDCVVRERDTPSSDCRPSKLPCRGWVSKSETGRGPATRLRRDGFWRTGRCVRAAFMSGTLAELPMLEGV